MIIKLIAITVALAITLKNIIFGGSIVADGSNSDTLILANAPTLISHISLQDYIPAIDITAGTECTLGVALVKAYGFNPTIQLINGQPLVLPPSTVIASQVYEFTSIDFDVQTETPFLYDSNEDTQWVPQHLNDLDEIQLLTILDCTGSAEVIYSGQIKWF